MLVPYMLFFGIITSFNALLQSVAGFSQGSPDSTAHAVLGILDLRSINGALKLVKEVMS